MSEKVVFFDRVHTIITNREYTAPKQKLLFFEVVFSIICLNKT